MAVVGKKTARMSSPIPKDPRKVGDYLVRAGSTKVAQGPLLI